jgi:hypothetical protein
MNKIEILLIKKAREDTKFLEYFLKELDLIPHIATYEEEALNIFKKENLDLIIISSSLRYFYGDSLGIGFTKSISEITDKKSPILFFGNEKDRKTFFNEERNLLPSVFFKQPFDLLELKYAIESAIDTFLDPNLKLGWGGENGIALLNGYLFIMKRDAYIKMKISEIIYLTMDGRYCKLVSNLDPFICHTTLSDMLEFLSQQSFIQTHRNYAVNMNRIKEVLGDEHYILMDNDEQVYIGRKQKQPFLEQYQLHSKILD